MRHTDTLPANPPSTIETLSIGARHATRVLLFLSAALLLTGAGASRAGPTLDNIEFAALPGNQVEIDLVMSSATAPPTSFATDSPSRIALDFPGVANKLKKRSLPIGVGVVHSVVAVEASNRTRVVINLSESVPYKVTTRGNRIVVAINVQETALSTPPPATPSRRPVSSAGRASHRSPSPRRGAVRDIDFRRGPNGEGRVLITLPSADTRVAVREQGKRILVDVYNTTLPKRLFRRLDVVDFATPVQTVESRPKGSNVLVDIAAADEYDYLAYQTDEQFTLEFRALTAAEKEQIQKKKIVYEGDRLSLNFQDIEVRAVLQLLADFTNLNLVASDTVRGNITLRLKNVPWDQALDIILKTKGLSMRQTGNVIMVAPTQEVAAQEKLELESQQQIADLAPLRSEFVQINYAKADELAGIIKNEGSSLLSERGNVTVDKRTNTLLVQDTGAKLEDIRRMVGRLDIPVRQVMIESRIVIANDDFARDLGVRFGFTTSMGRTSDHELAVLGGTRGHIAGTAPVYKGDLLGTQAPDGTIVPYNTAYENPAGSGMEALMVNLPALAPSGAVNFLLGKVGSYLLQLELSAMQREGRGEIVSSPRVITSDQRQASISVGQEIPYQTVSERGTQTEFKEATLKLDVTPHITPDDRIIMDLEVSKDNPDYTNITPDGVPIDTRSVETSVLVDNGETVVLGGVYERTKSFQKEQVPWFGDLPVVGNLFKKTFRQDINEELLIFVTPKILKADLARR